MAISTFNFFAVAALALVVGVTLIVVYLNLRKMRREIDKLREDLSLWQKVAANRHKVSHEPDMEKPENEPPALPTSEKVVELSAADEKKMLERLHRGGIDGEAPERYRHVAKLAGKGLDPEEIAQMLQVSTMEAQQLVKLSEVARKKN